MTRVIKLTKGQFTLVDSEDYLGLSRYTWHAWETEYGYVAVGRVKGKTIQMSRFILSAKAGQEVDHKNRRTLDNRRSNLRIATCSENARNRKPQRGKKYKGVYETASGRFSSHICKDWKRYYLGTFATEEEAAVAYDKAAVKLFGEFAYLNFAVEAAEQPEARQQQSELSGAALPPRSS